MEESVFNIDLKIYPIIPLGRAAYLEEKCFYLTPISDLDLSCKHSSTLFVDEKGDIYISQPVEKGHLLVAFFSY